MMGLLVFKEQLKAFYGKYDAYINPVIRFIYSLLAFLMINQNIGYMEKLKSPEIVLALSFVCAFLPYGAITVVMAGFFLAHLFSVSIEVALLTGVFTVILALSYYGFRPGDSYLVILTPMFFMMKIHYAIPLLAGLSGGIVSIIPICSGIIYYYIIIYVKENAGVLTGDASVELIQKYTQILKSIISNKMLAVMILAFAVCVIVVFLIKNLSIDYSWIIAITTGTIVQLGIIFVGDFTVNVSVPVAQLLFGIIISALIAGLYHFFVFAVDYSRTEYLQFEDDDYYYYVKAVPKITVSKPDVKVKKINSRKNQKNIR